MHVSLTPVRRTFTALTLAAIGTLAMAVPAMAQNDLTDAQQSAIKQKLAQRLPSIPAVDELRPAPVAGLIEVRAGDHVFYTDAKGEYLIDGNLIETRTQRNLTE